MPSNIVPTGVSSQPLPATSVKEQLAEVYALVDELHDVTNRLREKMERIIAEQDADPLFYPPHEEPHA